MKSLKIKSLKNSLVSIILCILLSFSCILFSSCTVDIEGELAGKTYFSQYIDSFKVVYANSLEGDESNIDNLIDDLARDSINILLYYYAYGDSSVDNANVFPDDIRMFVYSNKETRAEIENYYPKIDLNYRWKWTLNDNLDRNNINNLKPNSEETFSVWIEKMLGEIGIYKDRYNFLDIYLYPLQTVLYEIMLGYELTTFDIDYQKSDGSTIVTIRNCPSDTSLNGQEVSYSGNVRFKDYIDSLLSKYQRVTKYVGFTQENSDRMINYILDNVIGTDLVNYDYLTYGPSTQNTTYVKSIEKDAVGFKTMLGLEDDVAFNAYVSELEDGDLIYNASGYNHLIYNGTSRTGTNKRYYFEEYYNYRNYVQRVASIVYGNTYDGSSKIYEYSRDMYQGTTKIGTVSYDYVEANGGEPKIGELGSALARQIYSAKAATFLRNYEGETFFEDLSEDTNETAYAYGDARKSEYQSILLVPTDDKQFILEVGMGFNIIAYNPNLKVNIKARYYYYNEEKNTGTLFEFDAGETSFSGIQPAFDTVENIDGYETQFETSFDLDVLPDEVKLGDKKQQFVITPFSDENAKSSLSASGEINLGESENQDAANYYKVINSQNGYGGLTVLDESKIKCSFYEIVFDVVKNPGDAENTDYDFKISLNLIL